jgi:spermidine synthase
VRGRASRGEEHRLKRFPLALAFASGACALVYEILWARALHPVFGLSVHATSAVLCAFMAGLGIGSALAPRVITGLRGSAWCLYAGIELAIACTTPLVPLAAPALASAFASLALPEMPLALLSALRFALAVLVLLPPTLLIGLTLPVLVEAVREIEPERMRSARRIGALYGVNTLGAASGCWAVGFVLLPALGVRASSLAAASVNAAIALCAWSLARMLGARRTPRVACALRPGDSAAGLANPQRALSPRTVLWLYAAIGATSFGYELCWFRLLVFYLQSATYSLSLLLALFLAGTGIGSAVAARFLEPRLSSDPLRGAAPALALAQLGLAVSAAATFLSYAEIEPFWAQLIDWFGAESFAAIAFQQACVAALILIPPTFCMGISFPLLAVLYRASGASESATTAKLYAANTAGAVAGTLLTSFALFDAIGVQGALTLFSAASALLGLAAGWKALRSEPRWIPAAGVALGLLLLVYAYTPARALLATFERAAGRVLFYRESAADVTFVFEKDGVRRLAFGDGRGAASTQPDEVLVNRLLAYSAMASNPGAKRVLVISMGAGNTASAFAAFPIERLDIVDISPGVFEAAAWFPTNRGVLGDPRVHAHVEDGRNFLLRARGQWDVIQLELPTLHTDGVVYLYTREFYEIARARLAPGGILSQWIDAAQTEREPSYTLIRTQREVLGETSVWATRWAWWANSRPDSANAGIDAAAVRALFARPEVVADMASVGVTLPLLLAQVVAAGPALEAAFGAGPIVTDDRTRVDFELPKLASAHAFGGGVAYQTSPVQRLFLERWRSAGAEPARRVDMFPFHELAQQRRRSAESIRAVMEYFEPREVARVLRLRQGWNADPSQASAAPPEETP